MLTFSQWYARTYPVSDAMANAGNKEHQIRRDMCHKTWNEKDKCAGFLSMARPSEDIMHMALPRVHNNYRKQPRRKDKGKFSGGFFAGRA